MPERLPATGGKKTSTTPAAVQRAGGQGKKAFPAVAAPAAQLFPYYKKNVRSDRMFTVTHQDGEFAAVQFDGDKKDVHSGSLTYKMNAKDAELGHIVSNPEEGSGIGSMLVFYFAHVAGTKGKAVITIPTAAPTAIGFYELLGFVSANKQGSDSIEEKLAANPDQAELAAQNYIGNRARIRYDTNVKNRRQGKQWSGLGSDQRQALEEQEAERFKALSSVERNLIIATMLHGKAVSLVGMTGETNVVKEKARAQCDRWQPLSDWDRAWLSRKDKTKLTEFPRLSGE